MVESTKYKSVDHSMMRSIRFTRAKQVQVPFSGLGQSLGEWGSSFNGPSARLPETPRESGSIMIHSDSETREEPTQTMAMDEDRDKEDKKKEGEEKQAGAIQTLPTDESAQDEAEDKDGKKDDNKESEEQKDEPMLEQFTLTQDLEKLMGDGLDDLSDSARAKSKRLRCTSDHLGKGRAEFTGCIVGDSQTIHPSGEKGPQITKLNYTTCSKHMLSRMVTYTCNMMKWSS
jgi:hypothetical protein